MSGGWVFDGFLGPNHPNPPGLAKPILAQLHRGFQVLLVGAIIKAWGFKLSTNWGFKHQDMGGSVSKTAEREGIC